MGEQYYRLVRSHKAEKFSLSPDKIIEDLNTAAPGGYHFALVRSGQDTERIEVYKYVGEYDEDEFG